MYKREDKVFILDMLIACQRILRYTDNLSYEDFCNQEMVIDAVIRNIEVLGEAVKNISEDLKSKYPEIEWKSIAKRCLTNLEKFCVRIYKQEQRRKKNGRIKVSPSRDKASYKRVSL